MLWYAHYGVLLYAHCGMFYAHYDMLCYVHWGCYGMLFVACNNTLSNWCLVKVIMLCSKSAGMCITRVHYFDDAFRVWVLLSVVEYLLTGLYFYVIILINVKACFNVLGDMFVCECCCDYCFCRFSIQKRWWCTTIRLRISRGLRLSERLMRTPNQRNQKKLGEVSVAVFIRNCGTLISGTYDVSAWLWS